MHPADIGGELPKKDDCMTHTSLFQITSPYFCAGFEAKVGHVCRAAPILSYMFDWSIDQVRAYCIKRRWKLIEVPAEN